MKAKNTIIVLGAPLGRVGSSALMGLLNIAKVNIGGKKSGLGKASSSNPKGHFEPPSIKQFLTSVFPNSFPGLHQIPNIVQLKQLGKKHALQFERLLHQEFGNKYPLALKGGRLLVLPFLAELTDKYDVKVLLLQRNTQDQLNSIIRVWKKSKKLKKNATIDYLFPILNNWKNFVASVVAEYKMFSYYPVNFEEIITNPVHTMKNIAEFIGIQVPPANTIINWIDPRLVNRKK